MTVYRRPDPIPLRRAPASVAALAAVRQEPDDLNRLVAREIFQAIVGGRFPAGSILPREHQLAADLGVSRTALREAIKGLVSKGLLETRRKRGTQVLDRSRWNMLDGEVIAWSRRSGSSRVSEELWAAIVETQPAIAALAASGRHAHAALEAVERFAAAGGGPARRESVARLLCDLAAASENRFLASLTMSAVHSLSAEDPAFFDRASSGLDLSAVPHLATALRQRDAAAARAAMARTLQAAARLPAPAE